MSVDIAAIRAQAHLHHAYLLGLQLMVSTRKGSEVMGEWMFRLFRRQHEEKFLSSFEKLGLCGLPDAVACAQYHVLSNNMGGVGVEYMYENERKAWVRFRYPRWMYQGPAICGVPVEVSRGFLNGWYAHNGVSLGNPCLGFVCVSEDMTGEFGFCGYFREFDHELWPEERLRFARDEIPPAFDPGQQPAPPAGQWNEERLEKANRNYAIEFIRNGVVQLATVIGVDDTRELGGLAARLIGLQYCSELSQALTVKDGDLASAAAFLERMFCAMGDAVTVRAGVDEVTIEQTGLRIVRGMAGVDRDTLLHCWQQLWVGAMQSHQRRKALVAQALDDGLQWTLRFSPQR